MLVLDKEDKVLAVIQRVSKNGWVSYKNKKYKIFVFEGKQCKSGAIRV